ncbi:MAG: class I SAM-dependent methyltransferase [Actinomycetota bacterium]|nr:class I SAM-dependent methyltransferase [Actinomycetota bacterium]
MGRNSEHARLRRVFDEVADAYERARPLYPAPLFDDLVDLAELRRRARVVEIGCGTGQATVPLAERGLEIVCVELGEQLAAAARRRLADFPNVEVVHAPFETWQPVDGDFDAVVAFTAFHWIDPEARYEKSAALLRDEGVLAVVATQHVRREDGDEFWVQVQEDYDAIVPSEDNRPPPHVEEVGDLTAEIEASGRFRNVAVRRYLWDVSYTADGYIDVLDTYSGHRGVLDEETRRRLYERIHRRIEARPAQQVTKTHLATLNVARRTSQPD